ncbi:glycerol acyltransferase [Aliterella atlantica]|uniref:Glycerol acyltransferase n=1 Tax=Aliterella atlantica CENA595 TaxID=1618023 RepID=A0A0D8ZNQ6_9CYAN|nr:glycerol acyltransferase [Aliterella atlantica]KJH70448.1 glycerol acyltransferase [Aliterella atlantica CENA595]
MSVKTVQPPLKFIPPAFNPWVASAAQKLLPLWLQYRCISHIRFDGVEQLVELYRQFQLGKIRFIIAFRHPTLDDPTCLTYLLGQIVPQVACQHSVRLCHPIHAHFIYERGIPLWAGASAGWLLSRLGATPIHRGKLDFVGLRSARDLFANGSLPMAAAPEGTINGLSDRVNPLEPGVAQLAFWCLEDLLSAKRSEQVAILPVGIKYRYVRTCWQALEELLKRLESESGLSVNDSSMLSTIPCWEQRIFGRLMRLIEFLLSQVEDFYSRFYHQSLSRSGSLDNRLQACQNAALSVAESYFGLPVKGSLIERRHRVEQAGWDWIYRGDIQNIEVLSLIERGLADRVAQMTALYVWHMGLLEHLSVSIADYVREKPTFERLAETTLLLGNAIARMKGRNQPLYPFLGQRCVEITVGEAISVSQRWDAYRTNRRQAVDALTKDLQTALKAMT